MKTMRWLGRVLIGLGVSTFVAVMMTCESRAGSPEPTTTILATSQNPTAFGEPLTLTATVTSAFGTPAGKVIFESGAGIMGTGTLAGGVATLTRNALPAGTASITAVYKGAAGFAGSSSSALSEMVTTATSSVTLSSSLNPSVLGQLVTFTATVVPEFGGAPAGKVTFKDGTTTLGAVALTGSVATYATSTLSAGTLPIAAAYGGSSEFSASTSAVLKQVVTAGAGSVTVTSSQNPSIFGQPVTFTATVSSQPGNPQGLVSFYDGSVWLGDATLTDGAAAYTTNAVGVGMRAITAVYVASVSSALAQLVTPATSSVTVTSSLNPSAIGQLVTFTATVAPEFGGTPAGTLTFMNGGVVMGTATLAGGMAAITTSLPVAGTLSITADYVPTNGFGPSAGAVTQTVNSGGTANYELSAAPLNPSSVTAGSTASSVITVLPANSYTGVVNLACSVTGGLTPPTCSLDPSAVAIGGAGAATSMLTVAAMSGAPAGRYTVSVTGSDADSLGPVNGPQMLAFNTKTVIEHIVIIFQENRSTDNLFQDPVLIANGADIASSGINSRGQTVPLSPLDLGTVGSNPDKYDLSHSHSAFTAMYDGGKMDGADRVPCAPDSQVTCPPDAQFKYVEPSDVQPYFAMAEQYTFADRMFQTNEGPSFPAHQFILSGTSAPTATSPLFASGNPTQPSGCIALANTTVPMINAAGSESAVPTEYPCFEHATLSDLLDANGLSWRFYTISVGTIWTAPAAIEHLCQQQNIDGTLTCTGPDWVNNVVIPQTQVLNDIANGQLSQVSWVIPGGLQSDHAGANDGSGPSWVASIVNAIGNSPYWANTAVIITWDDWGGWYDHVAPKVIDDGVSWGSGYVYGFRVPLIVVAPYAKAGYISHVTHDFGSILKFIESNFNLPSLGYADSPADDLSDCFNFTQTPITFQTIAAPLDAKFFLEDKRPPTPPDDD